jgi:hypothetical protein
MLKLPDTEAMSAVLLNPGYRKSVAEVFCGATRCSTTVYQDLCICRFMSHRGQADIASDGFPSWNPCSDRHRTPEDAPLNTVSYRNGHAFAPAKDVALGREISDTDVLVVRGVKVAALTIILPMFTEEVITSSFTFMFGLVEHNPEVYNPRFARAMLADVGHLHERLTPVGLRRFDHWLGHMHSGPGKSLSDITQMPLDANEELRSVWECNQAMMHAINRRRFATTDSDLVAIVSKVAEFGDLIAYFDAGNTPGLLRPYGKDWRVLG